MPLSFPEFAIPAEAVGRPILAADSLSSESSRLKAGLRARLPAPRFVQNSAFGKTKWHWALCLRRPRRPPTRASARQRRRNSQMHGRLALLLRLRVGQRQAEHHALQRIQRLLP